MELGNQGEVEVVEHSTCELGEEERAQRHTYHVVKIRMNVSIAVLTYSQPAQYHSQVTLHHLRSTGHTLGG